MSKFKVGDLVKIVKPNNICGKMNYINQIHKIIRNESGGIEASQWWKLDDNSCFRWQEEELELVEKASIFCESYAVEKINKKEGNKMIESINLIDLYANKHRESIEKETKEKVEELRKKCDVINKYNELVEQFEKDCDELYLSQFTEEEKNKMLLNPEIAFDNYKPLREKNICNGPTQYRYYTNDCIRNEEIEKVENDMVNKVEEINDLVKTVKAHVGIAKTKEEVEEILTRYGIIDKKGKLVIK